MIYDWVPQCSAMCSGQVCRAVCGKLHTEQLSQVRGSWERTVRQETTHSSSILQCVALNTNCIHGLSYTGTAGLSQRKNVGSKRRKHSDVTQDQPIRKTAVRALNIA